MTKTKWPPGFYRTRHGLKVEVVGISSDPKHASSPVFGIERMSWTKTGKADSEFEDDDFDLVAPWNEPRKPTKVKKYRQDTAWPPGWYRTRNGSRVEVVGTSADSSTEEAVCGTEFCWNDEGEVDVPYLDGFDLISPWTDKDKEVDQRKVEIVKISIYDYESMFDSMLDELYKLKIIRWPKDGAKMKAAKWALAKRIFKDKGEM